MRSLRSLSRPTIAAAPEMQRHHPPLPLSSKKIPPRERLIFPLDVDTREQVNTLVRQLGDAVWFYKLGLQLFMSGNYWDLVAQLVDAGKKVFVDLKFYDVAEPVSSGVRRMRDCVADLATSH